MTRCFPLALISAVILCASSTNAAIVADALLYNWEASDGANANATTWTSPIGTINPVIDINTDVSRVGVSSETTISNAYDFTGWADDTSDGTATRSGTNDAFSVAESDLTDTDVTIELWIKPDGLTNGNQVVFETGGGTRGFNVSLWDDELRFAVKVNDGAENDPTNIVAHTLTSSDIGDFIQVVAVVDSANTHCL